MIESMQSLSREVWRLQPEFVNGGTSAGELAWLWGNNHRRAGGAWRHQLWTEDDATLAWAWSFPPIKTILSDDEWRWEPASLMWLVHPHHRDLLDDVLNWFEEQVPDKPRGTVAMETNEDARRRLERHGYRHDPEAPWGMLNIRELDEIEEPPLPRGYHGLTMRELDDVSRRVEVHRAAWKGSSVTEESYLDVMATPSYRDDLDVVIAADDGTLVASAIIWCDQEHRVGEFEPVGTRPDYRGRELGRALLLFGMQRLRNAGGVQAVVGCRGDDNYPIPKRLYRSVDFRELTRERRYIWNP